MKKRGPSKVTNEENKVKVKLEWAKKTYECQYNLKKVGSADVIKCPGGPDLYGNLDFSFYPLVLCRVHNGTIGTFVSLLL